MIHGGWTYVRMDNCHHQHRNTILNNLPLVRGLDAYWIEKIEGNKEMTAAEPLGDIHMPNAPFSPFIISLGLFIAAFGAMYMQGG